MRATLLAMVAFALQGHLAFAQSSNPPTPAIPPVSMEDQFEKKHDVKEHRGHVVVLIYGDRASADANRALGEYLHVAFHPAAKGQPPAKARTAAVTPVPGATSHPDVITIAVACIGKVPSFVRQILRGQIRNGSPEVPVWLDFEDTMKSSFGLKPGVPNVVILDTEGRYRHNVTGLSSHESKQKLVQQIEALRRETALRP